MIIWGTKTVYSNLGYAADFCPVCAAARPFLIQRIGSAGHIYYITAGEGSLVGYKRTCMTCRIELKAEPSSYETISKIQQPFSDLLVATFPNFKQVYADRLALEEQISRGPLLLAPEDRRQLLMTPFVLLSPMFERHKSDISFGGSYMKEVVLPILGISLQRLKPSESELQATLTRLVQLKENIGKQVKLPMLMAELARREALGTPATYPGEPVWMRQADIASVFGGKAGSVRIGGRQPHQKASLAIKIMSGIGLLGCLIVGASMLEKGAKLELSNWGAFAFLAIPSVLGIFIALGLDRYQSWARTTGIVLGLVTALGFPIGTAIGLYIAYQLAFRWEEGQPATVYA